MGAQPAQGQSWQLTDGAARDVGVGADGTVWMIGTNVVAGGYGIYKRTNNTWSNVPGGAERIAVDPQGTRGPQNPGAFAQQAAAAKQALVAQH